MRRDYRLGLLGGADPAFELGVEAERRARPLPGGTDHGALARIPLPRCAAHGAFVHQGRVFGGFSAADLASLRARVEIGLARESSSRRYCFGCGGARCSRGGHCHADGRA